VAEANTNQMQLLRRHAVHWILAQGPRAAGLRRPPIDGGFSGTGWLLGLALVIAWLGSGCQPPQDQSRGVQLLLSTDDPAPFTTFEVRFDEPMVRSSLVGAPVGELPLRFVPAVAGKFVWTSSRSGSFTPSQPFRPGLSYQVRLAPGLRRSDGKLSTARLDRTLTLPPFGPIEWAGPSETTNAHSMPVFRVSFNAPVHARDVAQHAGFASADGRWIPVGARQGRDVERGYGSLDCLPGLFDEVSIIDETGDEPLQGDRVVLWPSKPLGVGSGWRLVIQSGVPAADGAVKTVRPFEKAIGSIIPFDLVSAKVHHRIYQEPRLELSFSKHAAPELTNRFRDWLDISPMPESLRAELSGSVLTLSGGWARDVPYRVVLKRGLPSAEAFQLAAGRELQVEVPPIAPRLYFPSFATDQLAGGRRTLELLAVNVPRVRVRAKMLDATGVVHLLRGYRGYFDHQPTPDDSLPNYRRLDFNLVPGRTVIDREIAGTSVVDEPSRLRLEWDPLLSGLTSGVFFVEAERTGLGGGPALGAQTVVQLTDLGAVWKNSDWETRAFVFSYSTGRPVKGASVRLFTDENECVRETATDAEGMARLDAVTNASWLVVQAGQDLHALPLRENNLPSWWFSDTRWLPDVNPNRLRFALFSDRDIYRPGETVHLKVIGRELTESGLRIPAGAMGTISCIDARGRLVHQTNVVLSSLGSGSISLPLPPQGVRGGYRADLRVGVQEQSLPFQVAEFEPAAFDVQLDCKPVYAHDERPAIPVRARYLFGKALDRARVAWSLSARDAGFFPKGFEAFEFSRCAEENRWHRYDTAVVLDGSGELTSNASVVIDAHTAPNLQAPQPRTVSLLAEVTDLNQQTITRSVEFTRHSSEFYLGLRRPNRVFEPGHVLPVEVVALGADGAPWPVAVKAKLVLYRVKWEISRLQGAGRSTRYRSESSLVKELEQEVLIQPGLVQGDDELGGMKVDQLSAPGAGEYLLELSGQDSAANYVVSSVSFSVSDEAVTSWDYRNELEVKLVPDKPVYAPGETALVLVKTPISGQAWVTVEADRVLHSFLTRLDGNAPAVRVPIKSTYAPGVFVSVTLVRGAADSPLAIREPEFRAGCCRLQVEDPASRLRVEIIPERAEYRPGEEVIAEVLVRDHSGKACAGAEVTLYAVDEGVLAHTDYQVPDLHSVLLAPRRLEVESAISLPFLLPENPDRLIFQNKGYMGGGGGKESLRQNFLACAVWQGTTNTDVAGRVKIRFAAPDGLTRYRLIAVVHTLASQFGSAVAAVSVHKPLMVQPALPRFANVTDTLSARAVVMNQTGNPENVVVSLELSQNAAALPGAALSRTLRVAAQSSAAVDFPVRLTGTGQAQWIWRARFEQSNQNFSDAVRSTIDVGSIAPQLRESITLRITNGCPDLLREVNPQLLAGQGVVSVRLASTRIVTLSEAVRELLQYPYGCAEQTASSLLPWVVLFEAPDWGSFLGETEASVAQSVRAGVERLLSMQTRSGGLGYWPRSAEPAPWVSAYGAFVLALARAAGIEVPLGEFGELLAYVRAQLVLPGRTDSEFDCLAMAALAVAGRAEPGIHTQFLETSHKLSAENRALLALAMAVAGEDRDAVGPLLRDRTEPENPTHAFGSHARVTAIRLLASVAAEDLKEAERLYESLQSGRKRGHWDTTQGNAWALLASWRYARLTERPPVRVEGTLIWGQERLETGSGAGISPAVFHFELTPERATRPLRFESATEGPVYAQVSVRSRPVVNQTSAQDRGFRLERTYARLNVHNEPEGLAGWKTGDRVLVSLRLGVREPARFVAVEDPLPAILEAVNPEFKTQQASSGKPLPEWFTREDGDYWRSDFQELRPDRVWFFADAVSPGDYVIRFVARVRAAGQATAPAAKAEEMYHPERFGLTDSFVLTSEPGD